MVYKVSQLLLARFSKYTGVLGRTEKGMGVMGHPNFTKRARLRRQDADRDCQQDPEAEESA